MQAFLFLSATSSLYFLVYMLMKLETWTVIHLLDIVNGAFVSQGQDTAVIPLSCLPFLPFWCCWSQSHHCDNHGSTLTLYFRVTVGLQFSCVVLYYILFGPHTEFSWEQLPNKFNTWNQIQTFYPFHLLRNNKLGVFTLKLVVSCMSNYFWASANWVYYWRYLAYMIPDKSLVTPSHFMLFLYIHHRFSLKASKLWMSTWNYVVNKKLWNNSKNVW